MSADEQLEQVPLPLAAESEALGREMPTPVRLPGNTLGVLRTGDQRSRARALASRR